MKFLADQDVYAITVTFLSSLGHDVVRAAELGLAQAEDAKLLRVAHEHGRIFVSRDRDFGHLSSSKAAVRESSICGCCPRPKTRSMPNSSES